LTERKNTVGIGMDIKKKLAKLGTQKQAASAIGVDQRTLRRWIAGKSSPRGLSLRALERAVTNHLTGGQLPS
jgi:transcriptional regulator with XRE-family HTH domain